MLNVFHTFCFIVFSVVAIASADEPTLLISNGEKNISYVLSDLLKRKDLESIDIDRVPAYEYTDGVTNMTFKAIKATTLFEPIGIDQDAVIQFVATDGYAAPISKELLLNTDERKSIAYIALESPNDRWPDVKGKGSSPGPFYLIWKNPELSKIVHAQWPFKIGKFEVKGTLKALYPNIHPAKKIPSGSRVHDGFDLFVKHCFACHTMNKEGAGDIGPDLNLPMNPTEYFRLSALKKFIRNPQSVRHWTYSQMIAFPPKDISDQELNELIAYLKHMKKNKTDSTTTSK